MFYKARTGTRTIPLLRCMGALAILAVAACDQEPTSPGVRSVRAVTLRKSVAPGTLAIYTDRDAWLAAVAATGATVQQYDFTGLPTTLTTGKIQSRNYDYGPFKMAVDFFAPNLFNNPGVDVIPDASCSLLPAGDCNRMVFNMLDPSFTQTFPFDQPKVDSLINPQPMIAWGATFTQVGWAVGCGASCPVADGDVTLHFGSATVVLNPYLTGFGFGFVGVIAGTPSDNISFTFAKSGSFANDAIEVYRPEFANAPAVTKTPQELINDLASFLAGSGAPKGFIDKVDHRLDKTTKKLSQGKTAKACKELNKAVKEVTDEKDKKVAPSVKSQTLTDLNDILAALGC